MVYFSEEYEADVFVKKTKKTSKWITCKCNRKKLRFQLAEEIEIKTLEDIQEQLEVTETGLMVEINECLYYIRAHAVKSIVNVLGLGSAFKRMSPANKRIVLNKCIDVYDKDYIYFKIIGNWVEYCSNKNKEIDWDKCFKEACRKMEFCNASFFYGSYANGCIELVFKNKTKNSGLLFQKMVDFCYLSYEIHFVAKRV